MYLNNLTPVKIKKEVFAMASTKVHSDSERLIEVRSQKQHDVTALSVKGLLGKLLYALPRRQLLTWKNYSVALKMLIMYLAAKDYFIQSGIPKDLVELVSNAFGGVNQKPLEQKLSDSILFVGAAWHMRVVRTFNLLVEEFKMGKSIVSYGCGSSIIEILALIASRNKDARITLIDYDPVGIELTEKLIALFSNHGHDISNQVTTFVGDIHKHKLPSDTDTVISIGLLHNYFSLVEANGIMQEWFGSGVNKVITDIYYDADMVNTEYNDAKLRVAFVKNVCGWKLGPPNGLLFCSQDDFCASLPNATIDVYDHGINATLVVSQ